MSHRIFNIFYFLKHIAFKHNQYRKNCHYFQNINYHYFINYHYCFDDLIVDLWKDDYLSYNFLQRSTLKTTTTKKNKKKIMIFIREYENVKVKEKK